MEVSMVFNSDIYFETSAINFLSKKLAIDNVISTKEYQKAKGNRLYISPVAFWEILLTSNDNEREYFIYFSQHLFNENLLATPGEVIINYIKSGCPLLSKKSDIQSKSYLSQTWSNMCKDTRRTVLFNKNMLKQQVKPMRDLAKLLDHILKKDYLDTTKLSDPLATRVIVDVLLNKTSVYTKGRNLIDDTANIIHKISVLFILYILCFGLDIIPDTIEGFWSSLGISEIEDKINYVFTHYEILVFRGPFIEMAMMAFYQYKFGSSRGLFFDCLHSVYLPYIDYFLSNDHHFKLLKENIEHQNYKKIMLLDELELMAIDDWRSKTFYK
jgi:hypothetical protein